MNSFYCQDRCCKYHTTNYVKNRVPFIRNINENGKRLNRRKAGVFMFDPNSKKVLLVQSCGKLWGPPKGSLEENESYDQCAKRELLEETGMKINDCTYENPIFIKSNAVYFYFELEENECHVQPNDGNDANGIGWFNIDCLINKIKHGDIKVNQHLRLTFKHFLNIDLFQ